MLAVNSHIKGWTIKKALGSGGYGIVVVVEKDKVDAALKMTRDPRAMMSFRVEQQVLQQLSAGNGQSFVPSYLDSSFDGSQSFPYPFIVMTFEGESLQKILERQRNMYMTRHETFLVGFCIANALKHLHLLGYVHQDVKPDNILLSRSAGKSQFLLTDFGVASNLNHTGVTTGITVNCDYLYNDSRLMSGSRYCYLDDIGSLSYVMLQMRRESKAFRGDFNDRMENRRKLEAGEVKLSAKNAEFQQAFDWIYKQERRDGFDKPKVPEHDQFTAIIRASPHFETL